MSDQIKYHQRMVNEYERRLRELGYKGGQEYFRLTTEWKRHRLEIIELKRRAREILEGGKPWQQ